MDTATGDQGTPLAKKVCVACEGGVPPLPADEVSRYLAELQGPWEVVDGKKIRREFRFGDFAAAMAFVNKVAALAEREGHHPDIHVFYGRVVIELSTHAIGGLSENDFILAAKMEPLATSH